MKIFNDKVILSFDTNTSIEVFNSQGLKVTAFEGMNGEIDLGHFPVGIYFVVDYSNMIIEKVAIN